MQLSIYISEILDLNNLNQINARLQTNNQANKITGITSYSSGYCLQVIEGLEYDIKGSICDIFMNDSLQNKIEILNIETQQRFFSDDSLSLVSSLYKNDSFMALADFINKNVDLLSHSQKRLMSVFHNVEERIIPSAEQENPFNPLVYSISEWPDFGDTKPTYSIVSLCSYLINKPSCFRGLVNQKVYGREERVRSILKELNKSGYLHVAQQNNSAAGHTCEFHNSYLQKVIEVDKPVVDVEEISRITEPLPQKSKPIAAHQ